MANTRSPLYLTESEARNWFSLHSDDVGRPVVIVVWAPAPAGDGPWPPRQALGWNAQGTWVWCDDRGNPEEAWP